MWQKANLEGATYGTPMVWPYILAEGMGMSIRDSEGRTIYTSFVQDGGIKVIDRKGKVVDIDSRMAKYREEQASKKS